MTQGTYEGGCHCGAVRYRVELDLAQPAVTCNCSMCGRMGSMLAFVPAPAFTLVSGDDALTDYQFGSKTIHHLFCKVCGIRSFARGENQGQPMVAVNTRCLDGVDPTTVPTVAFDGASR